MLLENASYLGDTRVRREALALTAAGYQVTVISPAPPVRKWHETVQDVEVYYFPAPPSANNALGYLWEYFYSMAAFSLGSLYVFFRDGFDVVHVNQPPDLAGLVAGFYKLFGKKYVLDHHDLSPELYNARFRGKGSVLVQRTLAFFEKIACALADHVLATNQSYQRIEMQRDGVPEKRITIVRNGPSLGDMAPVEGARPARPRGKLVVGYEGVIGVQDGVDHLLRAIRHLIVDLHRTNVQCLIVGDGSALPGLHSLAKELGLGDFVQFTGWVDDQAEVQRYMRSVDICAAPEPADPYNEKSTAIKVMEYMSAGKPIVAFDIPEHRFTAQAAALYATPNDDLDFARKIECLMDDPQACERMGRFGRERIEKELAWEYQAAHLLEAYQSLSTGRQDA